MTSASKQFKTHAQQVELLELRGMKFQDHHSAEILLGKLNYYRLSGYWHSLRRFDRETGHSLDMFRDGASFELVVSLYKFDEKLRHVVLGELAPIELAVRAKLGYELGRINPYIHLAATQLGAPARQKFQGRTLHEKWLEKYTRALQMSKEDFVHHHKIRYGGKLPVWAAVEVMDWGMLSYLYGMAPNIVRNKIARQSALSAPQLESWLKSLNIVRNYAAHHARMFNRVYDIKPKLSQDPRLESAKVFGNRIFGQLTLIQYLHREFGLSAANCLPSLLTTYPENSFVPSSRLGLPADWNELELWKV